MYPARCGPPVSHQIQTASVAIPIMVWALMIVEGMSVTPDCASVARNRDRVIRTTTPARAVSIQTTLSRAIVEDWPCRGQRASGDWPTTLGGVKFERKH